MKKLLSEIWYRLSKWAVGWIRMQPHFKVGDPKDPYLLRWYILPRNPLCNIYLHKFMRDDDDRAPHDHPWLSMSILLKGEYEELVYSKNPLSIPGYAFIYYRSWKWIINRADSPIVFRKAIHRHRVVLPEGKPAWTLFITGPTIREWGFWCDNSRFVHHSIFTRPGHEGEIGKGCD